MSQRVNFTITIEDQLKKKLAAYSEATGVPQGVVLQRLADGFLDGRIKTNDLPQIPRKP